MTNNSIKLLVLDIDGTIAGQSNQVREAVTQAVQAVQARGIPVAIATGRMYRSALRFHQTIGSTLPLLAYQGAMIRDPVTDAMIHHKTVPMALTLDLLDMLECAEWRDRLSIHVYIDDQLYVRELSGETVEYGERSGVVPIAVGNLRQALTTDFATEPTKLLALSDDLDLVEAVLRQLRQRYSPEELYLTKSVANFFEATHPQANKGVAVQYLAEEMLGLTAANVMAIGDNFNDVEMLQYAGIGVAMAESPDAVKAIADWVAPSVEADGAAIAIHRFLL
jgi:Cof subfamily protein (haloacid dehalogenase superfamily)